MVVIWRLQNSSPRRITYSCRQGLVYGAAVSLDDVLLANQSAANAAHSMLVCTAAAMFTLAYLLSIGSGSAGRFMSFHQFFVDSVRFVDSSCVVEVALNTFAGDLAHGFAFVRVGYEMADGVGNS